MIGIQLRSLPAPIQNAEPFNGSVFLNVMIDCKSKTSGISKKNLNGYQRLQILFDDQAYFGLKTERTSEHPNDRRQSLFNGSAFLNKVEMALKV